MQTLTRWHTSMKDLQKRKRPKQKPVSTPAPTTGGGVAAGVRLAAAQVQKLQKAAVKSTLPPEVAAYWDAVDQQNIR